MWNLYPPKYKIVMKEIKQDQNKEMSIFISKQLDFIKIKKFPSSNSPPKK